MDHHPYPPHRLRWKRLWMQWRIWQLWLRQQLRWQLRLWWQLRMQQRLRMRMRLIPLKSPVQKHGTFAFLVFHTVTKPSGCFFGTKRLDQRVRKFSGGSGTIGRNQISVPLAPFCRIIPFLFLKTRETGVVATI